MSATVATLICRGKQQSQRLLFGRPQKTTEGPVHGGIRQRLLFAPGQIFGLYFWQANDYGTVALSVYICRAVSPGEPGQLVPNVAPGAEVLWHASGKKSVRQVIGFLLACRDAGEDPSTYPAEAFYVAKARARRNLAPLSRAQAMQKIPRRGSL